MEDGEKRELACEKGEREMTWRSQLHTVHNYEHILCCNDAHAGKCAKRCLGSRSCFSSGATITTSFVRGLVLCGNYTLASDNRNESMTEPEWGKRLMFMRRVDGTVCYPAPKNI